MKQRFHSNATTNIHMRLEINKTDHTNLSIAKILSYVATDQTTKPGIMGIVAKTLKNAVENDQN